MTKMIPENRNYWVWVTKPEYYLDRNGQEREALEPSSEGDEGEGWWTCHKDTCAGDLVLLYRTRPQSDIAYLLEARSDARLLEIEPPDGSIFQSDFRALCTRICSKNPELEAKRVEINRLDAELYEMEVSLQAILARAVTRNDKDLLKEWEELFRTGSRIRKEELESLTQEVGNSSSIPEGAVENVRKISDPRWAGLGRAQNSFQRRASAESDVFFEFFKLLETQDALSAKSGEFLEEFDRAVFASAGLPEDTFVEDDPEFSGSFVCDWTPRYKFEVPLSLAELKADPYLSKEWNALRASFKGRSFRTSPEIWSHLISKALPENPGLSSVLKMFQESRISRDIVAEKTVEDYLRDHLEVLEPKYFLDLYQHPSGRDGQQFQCPEAGGFIDLLCMDRGSGDFMVIELKAGRAGRNVAGQIKTYMGWVREKLAGGNDVRGLIISKGYDKKLKFALADMPLVDHVDLAQIWPPK